MYQQNRQNQTNRKKPVITNKFSIGKYAVFLGINIPLVVFPLLFIVLLQKGGILAAAFTVLAAIGIIFVQYPLLVLLKHWVFKSIIFYLSMVTFFFVYGTVIGYATPAGGYEAGSLNALIHGGIVMIFFGHLFGGIIICPVIVLINWLLRKKTFVYAEN
mgnify:CR=1 FL=1